MSDIIKIEVRIPANRKKELLELADRWLDEAGHKGPGWDAKAIHDIAQKHYGSLKAMFSHHGWPERGSKMMQQVQARVRETYGNVEAFVEKHSR